ncbi:MAG TPA: A24 family peptidase [Amycolatopsis sp.]
MEWGLFSLVIVTGALAASGAGLLVRGAGAPISLRLAAMVAGAGAAVVAWRWQAGGWPGWWLPVAWLVTVLGAPLALADVRHRRLPDVLTLPAYPLLAVALAGGGLETLTAGLAGALLFGGAHLLVRHFAPGQLGAGDVKLTGSLGAVLGAVGWPALAFAAVAASFLSAALAAAGRLRTLTRRPGKTVAPPPKPGDGPEHPTSCPHPPIAAAGGGATALAAAAATGSATAADKPSPAPRPHPRAVDPRSSAVDASHQVAHPRTPAPCGGRAAGSGTPGASDGRTTHRRTPGRSHRPARPPRVPHGPALLLATWLCAVVAGPGSGVAMS